MGQNRTNAEFPSVCSVNSKLHFALNGLFFII